MIYLGLGFLSVLLTYLIRMYAHKKAIFDIPNERSSHTIPTPRGGGLAIVIVIFIGLFYLQEHIENRLFYALLCAIPITLVGIFDDLLMLSSKLRLFIQSISAIGALYFLGGVSHIDFVFFELDGPWLNVIAFISIVWLTNLYNFLDGIDGYAGSEAVMVGLGIFLLFQNPLGLVIAVASLGFLVFNWHKASIFMGDVGSTTLGFIFAVLVFYDTSSSNIYIWLILLSLFWFDATLTLIRRYVNGESITQAHKKHAYQRLTQSGWGHDKVVSYSIVFNLIFIVLLYFVKVAWAVFLLNILLLMLIMKLIDTKKSFI